MVALLHGWHGGTQALAKQERVPPWMSPHLMQGLGSAQPLRAPAAVERTRTMHSKNLHILAIRHTPSAHITIQPFIKLEQCARFSSFFFLFLPSPAHVRLLQTYRSQTIVSPPMQQYSRLCIHLIDVPPAILGAEDHTFTNAKAATSLWRCCVGRAALWKRISPVRQQDCSVCW